ncbi:MAG: late transcription factor VLTF3-like protein [Terrestrivirus sp.]|uniref:Late transcription factor VLTF3-like protein n=1 Tax=Terrestrivirus sp. TaxID=2487775 RepID=A0A3G4ZQD1_9VIRU|nr:MAG: late transcription factor VLTF3-like protein [Terrestrivirus sp.]
MSAFKYKPDKIKHLSNIDTLDTIHRKHVTNFDSRRNNLTDLKNRLLHLEMSFSSINVNQFGDPTLYMKKKSSLKDEINTITGEIYDIENNVSELEYYSNIYDIALDYYYDTDLNNASNTEHVDYQNTQWTLPPNNNVDTLTGHFEVTLNDKYLSDSNNQNKKDGDYDTELDDGKKKLRELQLLSQQKRKPKKITRRRMRKSDINDTTNILDFFSGPITVNTENVKNNTKTEEQLNNPKVEETKTKNKIEYVVTNKATLFDNYMKIINKTSIEKDKKDRLKLCGTCGIEKTILQSEGICVCVKCGEAEPIIIESEIPSHKDTVVEKVHYPYKRINHLMESDLRIVIYVCIY